MKLLLFFTMTVIATVSGQKYNADQVTNAAKAAGYNPPKENVDAIVKAMNEKDWANGEQAMFIAQLFHESRGLTKIEEEGCEGSTKCAKNYPSTFGVPGKSYHGRGFIQLKWDYNYRDAGHGIGLGDELVKNPEKLVTDKNLAGKTSVWFWKNRVWNKSDVSKLRFGSSTRAINSMECDKGKQGQPAARWEIYQKVANSLNAQPRASEGGCYN